MAQRLAQRSYTPLVGGSNPSSPTIPKVFIFKIFKAWPAHLPSKAICFIDSSLTFRNSKTGTRYDAPSKIRVAKFQLSGKNNYRKSLSRTSSSRRLDCGSHLDILCAVPYWLKIIVVLLAFPDILFCQTSEIDEVKAKADKEAVKQVPSREDYRKQAMTRSGNPARGKKLFAGNRALCAHCHSTDGSGRLAGPDLAAAGDKFSRADLISSVLEPSANIMAGFALYDRENKGWGIIQRDCEGVVTNGTRYRCSR